MHIIKIKEITLKIIIADLNQKFIDFVLHFKEVHYFKHTDNIFGFNGRFEDLSYNNSVSCMVGAGNSFGALTGGVDLSIRNYFGKHVEELLQKTILDDYLGELPVGSALVIPTSHKVIPYLSYSPTMRTPKILETKDFIDFTGNDQNIKGSLIGMIIGILGGPLGILLGWFTGSMIGSTRDMNQVRGALSIFEETIKLIPEDSMGAILIAEEEKEGHLNDLIIDKLGGKILRIDRTLVEQEIAEAKELEEETSEDAKRKWFKKKEDK